MFPMTVTLTIHNETQLRVLSNVAAEINGDQPAPAKETPKPAADKPKAEKPKPEAAKTEPKPEAPAANITRADVSKLAVTLATKGQRDAVVSILAEHGAQAVTGSDSKTGIADEDLAAVHAKLQAVTV